MSAAVCFNLEQSEILSAGNGLMQVLSNTGLTVHVFVATQIWREDY